jgi:hypothetical protein
MLHIQQQAGLSSPLAVARLADFLFRGQEKNVIKKLSRRIGTGHAVGFILSP